MDSLQGSRWAEAEDEMRGGVGTNSTAAGLTPFWGYEEVYRGSTGELWVW